MHDFQLLTVAPLQREQDFETEEEWKERGRAYGMD